MMNESERMRREAVSKFVGQGSIESGLDQTVTGLKAIDGGHHPFDTTQNKTGENWQETLRQYKDYEKMAEQIGRRMGYQAAREYFIKAIELADKLSADHQATQESLKQSLKVLSSGVMIDGTILSEAHEQILHAATVQTIRNCQYSSEIRNAWGKVLLKGQKFFEAAEMFHSAEKYNNKIDSYLVKQEIALLEACSRRIETRASVALAYMKASQRIALDKAQSAESSPLSTRAWANFRGGSAAKNIFSGVN